MSLSFTIRRDYCPERTNYTINSLPQFATLSLTGISFIAAISLLEIAAIKAGDAALHFRYGRIVQGSKNSLVAAASLAFGCLYGTIAFQMSNALFFCPKSIQQL